MAKKQKYPKRGKPHITKIGNGYHVQWVPNTVTNTRLRAAFQFANKLTEQLP